jgi:hypothetical protein
MMTMSTSQTRTDINRANAKHSTGPRSAEGKARSRMNALTHGLRAEEVVIPTEDATEFQEFLAAWIADWNPPTMARRQLVEHAAVAAWRLKRCVRLESSRMGLRIKTAHDIWDASMDKTLDAIVEGFGDDPAGCVEKLRSTCAGVCRLLDLWADIERAAASPESWHDYDDHHFRFIYLHGFCAGDIGAAELKDLSWRLVVRNNLNEVFDDETKPFDDAEALDACDRIRAIASAKSAELRDLWETVPDDSTERDNFAEVSAYITKGEDVVMLRYEGQQDRIFRSSLNQLTKLTQTGVDLIEETEAPNEASAVVPEAAAPNEATAKTAEPPAPNEARPARTVEALESPGTRAEATAPNEARVGTLELVVARVDRDLQARFGPISGAA